MSRDELVAVVAGQAERLAARDRQIAEMAGKLGELMETNCPPTCRFGTYALR
jgi:hypothetical protein